MAGHPPSVPYELPVKHPPSVPYELPVEHPPTVPYELPVEHPPTVPCDLAVELRWVPYAPTVAESRSRIAASMRSAMRWPVKPTSSCSSAGLPWVT